MLQKEPPSFLHSRAFMCLPSDSAPPIKSEPCGHAGEAPRKLPQPQHRMPGIQMPCLMSEVCCAADHVTMQQHDEHGRWKNQAQYKSKVAQSALLDVKPCGCAGEAPRKLPQPQHHMPGI